MTMPEKERINARSAAETPPAAPVAAEGAASGTPAAASGTPAAAPATPAVKPARPHRANSVTALLMISALVAAGGVGYAVGHATAQTGSSQTLGGPNGQNLPNDRPGQNGQNGLPGVGPNASDVPAGPGGQNVAAPAAATVSGTVVSVTASSITIRLPNGGTVTIPTDASTAYSIQEPATSGDVSVGATVIVRTSGGSGTASASAVTAAQVIVTGK